LKYKQVTLSVLVLFFALGVYSLVKMPRREDPKMSIPQGLVVAYYPGASSSQIEEQVTRHIEDCIFRFDEVKKTNTVSVSSDGKVVVTVELTSQVSEQEKNIFWNKLRNEMALLKQTKLPNGVIGPMVNSEFGDTKALLIGTSGTGVTTSQLRDYAQLLSDELRTLPSVSKISYDGFQQEQLSITLNATSLARYHITAAQVFAALQAQNADTPGGAADTGNNSFSVIAGGRYATQADVENQIVGISPLGSDVRVKDVARVTREYAKPSTIAKVGNNQAVIISVEMAHGNNIVDFGKQVNSKISHAKQHIPSNVDFTFIANQPLVVSNNVGHFINEFFIAIVAVIIVIMLLLPLRVAMVASMAIPMTIAITLAVMNLCGIELQQVSLAALIVVLGLVVDDAIVVADNYIDLLDRGERPALAAWKSATELITPILVATLTIIFAFLPMTILSGAVGEFIESCPLTVLIALSSSFVVAMLFTPLLCLTFIKKGLNSGNKQQSSKSLLTIMQKHYDHTLVWCLRHKIATMVIAAGSLALALLTYRFGLRQQFFPSAERNQFVIELWMPTGTRLQTTEAAAASITRLIDGDSRIDNYSTFIGYSAPRFYYNHAPEFPAENFAQIVVNTVDNATALQLASQLTSQAPDAVPAGRVLVKLMQQGKPLASPVEIRIRGNDAVKLQLLGEKVDSILRNTPGTMLTWNNWHEPYPAIKVTPKPEATRLGITQQAISLNLYAALNGIKATELREADNTVDVMVFTADSTQYANADLSNCYITSPITWQSMPLSQVATISTQWKPGRIAHRNGVKELAVQCQLCNDALPAEVLALAKPAIEQLQLPEGFSIAYGGEDENRRETFAEMLVALAISLLLIFFVILLQFRHINETLVILLTIPLSTFGALLGLYLTGNNFGFSAFLGIICLSGIVVRNSIILVDHIHELHRGGMPMHQAVVESGKRRLRPIFLTAMAAAIGVIPMIISGSSMWSPLAAVIAFGVVWSMPVALLIVPVAYLLWIVKQNKQ
ncbi:MAG: efflux RND transporter permease subunit, partial [Muribaculaceae bacterium]